jgi:ABC-type transport system involved in cytochrome bd biosynthesis fused ATPase/permease subunit
MAIKIVQEAADLETYKEWRNTDQMSSMAFNPLVMFVVVPTIVQASCLLLMGTCMYLNVIFFA